MDRITQKDLQYMVDRINELHGSPKQAWVATDKGSRANVGNFHLSYAYGGVTLHRMHNEGGGVTTPLGMGYGTKRELYNKMSAYIAGLEAKITAPESAA